MPSSQAPPLTIWLALWARAARFNDDLARLSLCVALPEAIRSAALTDAGGHHTGLRVTLEKCLSRLLAWASTLIPDVCVPVLHSAALLALSDAAGAGSFLAGGGAASTARVTGVVQSCEPWLAHEAAFGTAAVLADALSGAILACSEVAQGASDVPPVPPHALARATMPPPSPAAVVRDAASATARAVAGSGVFAWMLLLLASEPADTALAVAADAREARGKNDVAGSALAALLRASLATKASIARLCAEMARAAGRPCAEVLLLQVRWGRRREEQGLRMPRPPHVFPLPVLDRQGAAGVAAAAGASLLALTCPSGGGGRRAHPPPVLSSTGCEGSAAPPVAPALAKCLGASPEAAALRAALLDVAAALGPCDGGCSGSSGKADGAAAVCSLAAALAADAVNPLLRPLLSPLHQQQHSGLSGASAATAAAASPALSTLLLRVSVPALAAALQTLGGSTASTHGTGTGATALGTAAASGGAVPRHHFTHTRAAIATAPDVLGPDAPPPQMPWGLTAAIIDAAAATGEDASSAAAAASAAAAVSEARGAAAPPAHPPMLAAVSLAQERRGSMYVASAVAAAHVSPEQQHKGSPEQGHAKEAETRPPATLVASASASSSGSSSSDSSVHVVTDDAAAQAPPQQQQQQQQRPAEAGSVGLSSPPAAPQVQRRGSGGSLVPGLSLFTPPRQPPPATAARGGMLSPPIMDPSLSSSVWARMGGGGGGGGGTGAAGGRGGGGGFLALVKHAVSVLGMTEQAMRRRARAEARAALAAAALRVSTAATATIGSPQPGFGLGGLSSPTVPGSAPMGAGRGPLRRLSTAALLPGLGTASLAEAMAGAADAAAARARAAMDEQRASEAAVAFASAADALLHHGHPVGAAAAAAAAVLPHSLDSPRRPFAGRRFLSRGVSFFIGPPPSAAIGSTLPVSPRLAEEEEGQRAARGQQQRLEGRPAPMPLGVYVAAEKFKALLGARKSRLAAAAAAAAAAGATGGSGVEGGSGVGGSTAGQSHAQQKQPQPQAVGQQKPPLAIVTSPALAVHRPPGHAAPAALVSPASRGRHRPLLLPDGSSSKPAAPIYWVPPPASLVAPPHGGGGGGGVGDAHQQRPYDADHVAVRRGRRGGIRVG